MRKIGLTILALCASLDVSAVTIDSSNLGAAVTKSITQQSTNTQQPTIVYGGKDISRSIVAMTQESTWLKQPVVIV